MEKPKSNLELRHLVVNYLVKERKPEKITLLDVSEIEDFSKIFYGMKNIQKLDLSTWEVKQAYKFDFMFSQSDFSGMGIQNWTMKNAVSAQGMFMMCKYLDINNFDISSWVLVNIKDISFMFDSSDILKTKTLKKLCLWDRYINENVNTFNMFGDGKDWEWFKEEYNCEFFLKIKKMNKRPKKSAKELIRSLKNYIIRDV